MSLTPFESQCPCPFSCRYQGLKSWTLGAACISRGVNWWHNHARTHNLPRDSRELGVG
jgi:hypothetical protein